MLAQTDEPSPAFCPVSLLSVCEVMAQSLVCPLPSTTGLCLVGSGICARIQGQGCGAQALFLPVCESSVVSGNRWPPGLRRAGHTRRPGLYIPGLRGDLEPGTRPYWKCLPSPTQWRARTSRGS